MRPATVTTLVVFLLLGACDSTESDWSETSAANTVEAYESFLAEHPGSAHEANARAGLEKAHFEASRAANTESAYEAHVERFPSGSFAEACATRIRALRFNQAVATNSESGYRAFLERYPSGPLSEDVRGRLGDIAFRSAEAKGTLEAYRSFVDAHPQSAHAESARSAIRTLEAWDSAQQAGTPAAYREFVAQHPESAHAAEATEKMEELSLRAAFASVASREEYAGSDLTLERARAIVDPFAGQLDARTRQQVLDTLVARATLGHPRYSIPAIQPLPPSTLLDPSAESSVMVAGTQSGRHGYKLVLSGMILRADRRLNGSVHRCKGRWGEPPGKLKRIGLTGCLAVSMREEDLVMETELPRDEIYVESNMRGGAPTLLPMGSGSVYRITGKVEGLFEGCVLDAAEGSTLCFALLDRVGLAYLSGKGSVTLPDGTTVVLPPPPADR